MIFWSLFAPYVTAVFLWLGLGALTDIGESTTRVVAEYAFSIANLAVALFILSARPRDLRARVLAVAMIGTAATFNHQSHSFFTQEVVGPHAAVEQLHTLLHVVSGVAYLLAVILFPDGELLPRASGALGRRTRLGVYGLVAAQVAVLSFANRASGHPGQGFFIELFGLAIPAAGVAAQTVKAQSAAGAQDRSSARLLRAGLLPLLAMSVALLVSGADEQLGAAVLPACFAVIPAVLAVGIVRYRVLDIQVVLSRALVYGSLVAVLTGAYLLTSVVIGSAVGATALVAVAFDPLRRGLREVTNRAIFGSREAPFEVLERLALELADSVDVEEVLPRVAETVARAVSASGAAVQVDAGVETLRSAWGDLDAVARTIDVVFDSEVVGVIEVAGPPGSLSRADHRILQALADQAAPSLASVRLVQSLRAEVERLDATAAELHRSKRRLAEVRDAARRGLAHELAASVGTLLDQVETRLRAPDPDHEEAIALSTAALEALRSVARGVYPSVLGDHGLVAALRSASMNHRVDVSIDASLEGRRLDPTVESAAYFCLAELWSTPSPDLRVSLAVDAEELRIDVHGAPRSGLTLLSDRIAALGGHLGLDGRRLSATLPLVLEPSGLALTRP